MIDCAKELINLEWSSNQPPYQNSMKQKKRKKETSWNYIHIDGLSNWSWIELCVPSVDFTHLSLSVMLTICEAAFLRSNSSATWKHKHLLKWNENDKQNKIFF